MGYVPIAALAPRDPPCVQQGDVLYETKTKHNYDPPQDDRQRYMQLRQDDTVTIEWIQPDMTDAPAYWA